MPITPHEGEVKEEPPRTICTPIFPDEQLDLCAEVPGFKDGKFLAAKPPLYVKVFHPSLDYPAEWNGEYWFLWKRMDCSSIDEACTVVPFQGTTLKIPTDALSDVDVDPAAIKRFPPLSTVPPFVNEHWYAIHVDAGDGGEGAPQDIKIVAEEDGVGGDPKLSMLEVLDSDGSTVLLQDTTPDRVGATKWRWEIDDAGGQALDPGDAGLSEKKYYIRVTRQATDEIDYGLWWETDLTWLFGPGLSGGAAHLVCDENNDWGAFLTDDEIYMQVIVDGVTGQRYPLPGLNPADSNYSAVVETDFGENDDHIEWTERVFGGSPGLGPTIYPGVSFAEQRGIKFIDTITLELIEDDGLFNLDDDVARITFDQTPAEGASILGHVPGTRTLLDKDFPGPLDGYHHRGGTVSHYRPHLPCATTDDCNEPLVCSARVCRNDVLVP